jgi:imidazolonepropionase-like amidohydrolase
MRTHSMFPIAAIAGASMLVCAVGAQQRAARPALKAFVGARLIDGAGGAPIPQSALVVQDGVIVSAGPLASTTLPAGVQHIDLSGKTITPGLVNAHGHVGETQGLRSGAEFYTPANVRRQLAQYASYGVTTVMSLGGDRPEGLALRAEQAKPGFGRARLYGSGPVLQADSPEAARRAVDDIAAMGVDMIKIRVDDNLGATAKMPEPVYRAVIDQAHKRNLRVAAHIYYLEDARRLLDAGVDFLAHSVRDRDVDSAFAAELKRRDVCLCPTLTREVSTFVYESRPSFFDDPFFLRSADRDVLSALTEPKRMESVRASTSAQHYKTALQTASRNLAALSKAGVRIAVGTDTGPPARFQGYFEHMELDLMVKAGLSPGQALRAAWSDAASCLKLDGKLGSLRPGAWADFIVVNGDPLADVAQLRRIDSVWIGGERLAAAAGTANAPAAR